MSGAWLPQIVLRAASTLVSSGRRADWMEEWLSELWYIPRRKALRFCFGAFRDAWWLRRHDADCRRRRPFLESPLACLAFLAAVAVMGCCVVLSVPGPGRGPWPAHFALRDIPAGCSTTLLLSVFMLPAIAPLGPRPTYRYATSFACRLRRGAFFALKVALAQPILFCLLMVWVWIAPFAPFAPFFLFAGCLMTLRWILADQSRRCPVCLRRLGNPVRIGAPSQTFLAWYGDESICSRGHGLLQDPEISASYSARQWLDLDASWRAFHSEPAGVRQP